MNHDKLLTMDTELLADEVMRVLKSRLGKTGDGPVTGNKRRLLVIGSLDTEEKNALLDRFQLLKPEKWYAGSSPEDFPGAEQWDLCLLASLPAVWMPDLAFGSGGRPETETLLMGLLLGKPVYLLERGLDYLRHKETAPKPLLRKYQEYETAMYANGIRRIEDVLKIKAEEEGKPFAQGTHGFCDPALAADFSKSRLLRESDLLKARVPGMTTVAVGCDTIVTPLAMDYITNHGLLLCKKG